MDKEIMSDTTQLGQLQMYIGDGKGKTTAAIGLAVRAAGAGFRVAFIQFDKGYDKEEFYSERNVLRAIPGISVLPTGMIRMMPDGNFRFKNIPDDLAEAQRGLQLAREAVSGSEFDVIICDEILSSILTKLITREEVEALIETFRRQKGKDLILTGRTTMQSLIDKADLVTEMKKLKHYFDQGKPARRGIEF
jgi:cob(I)alamin adenosyltransferase